MEEISINNEGVCENSHPQPTPKKGVDQGNQTIQQLEAALRELLERQTREVAIAIEAVRRAEELAKKQQAILDEAEKREKDQLEMLNAKELPKKFRYTVEIEPYDRTTDPKHHLDAFENRMLLVNATDAIQCKVVTITLKKDALT
ncbi:hypothetical protein PIB30_070814 [Stylosanthes scabra]|uniref:Uncharacterized protein n=1 Tax=Stylosanthes scabra TaxID=79078 RepID=A0ABU6TP24_9FABA|nr:hypothetical protein [Stylosanthes scabra]